MFLGYEVDLVLNTTLEFAHYGSTSLTDFLVYLKVAVPTDLRNLSLLRNKHD